MRKDEMPFFRIKLTFRQKLIFFRLRESTKKITCNIEDVQALSVYGLADLSITACPPAKRGKEKVTCNIRLSDRGAELRHHILTTAATVFVSAAGIVLSVLALILA